MQTFNLFCHLRHEKRGKHEVYYKIILQRKMDLKWNNLEKIECALGLDAYSLPRNGTFRIVVCIDQYIDIKHLVYPYRNKGCSIIPVRAVVHQPQKTKRKRELTPRMTEEEWRNR